MKTTYLIIISLVIGFLIGFTISKISIPEPTLTGQVIENTASPYTYTTAICNDNNECIDVLVTCNNSQVSSLEPVSPLLEFGEDWEDFRGKPDTFCN